MLVLHTNEESTCAPAPRKPILQQAATEESQCNQQLVDGIFVLAIGSLSQLLGGERNPSHPHLQNQRLSHLGSRGLRHRLTSGARLPLSTAKCSLPLREHLHNGLTCFP